MQQDGSKTDRKVALWTSALGGLIASLCCVTPIVMVSLGLASVTVANNWGNLLYGDYKWHFRSLAAALVAVALIAYFRSQGVCTLDQAKRQRNRILNVVMLVVLTFNAVYIFWNYVVLHAVGIAAGLPWAQWDESWARPVSLALVAAAGLAYWLLPKVFRVSASPLKGSGADLDSGLSRRPDTPPATAPERRRESGYTRQPEADRAPKAGKGA